MFNFNGMPYKRSGRAGGKSVSMIGMLVLLLAALLILPSCFDDDDEVVTCAEGTMLSDNTCVPDVVCGDGTVANDDGMCVSTSTITCGDGTMPVDNMCVPTSTVTGCGDGTMEVDGVCVADDQCGPGTMEVDGVCVADSQCGPDTNRNEETNRCEPVISGCGSGTTNMNGLCVADSQCGDGTVRDMTTGQCEAAYDVIGELDGECYMDGDRDGMVQGTDEAECIMGEGGRDSIKGMGGKDNITGGPGNDRLYGGAGDDTLDGMAGNDTLDGGPDNDELIGGSGDNTLDGGAGDADIAIYLGSMRVVVSLKDNRARVQHGVPEDVDPLLGEGDDGTGTDKLENIENVEGTRGRDIIDGDEKANLLMGRDGMDTINGHGGDDTIFPNRPAMLDATGVLVSNTADGNPNVPLTLDGEDVVDGGAGSDTISYAGESAGVVVDLSTITPAVGAETPNDAGDDVIAHFKATTTIGNITDMIKVVNIGTEDESNVVSTIENVTGGFGTDTLTGDARANTLIGGGEVDTLRGEAEDAETGGDDMLVGGPGGDTLHGGPGGDTLNGDAGNDTLNGDAGNDTLVGGAGDNTYNGGAGDDTFVVLVTEDDVADDVTEAVGGGMDTLSFVPLADNKETMMVDESEDGVGGENTSVTTPNNVEEVLGSPNADNITAAPGGATILGREGNDDLNGGIAVDVLVGCAGSNTLNGGGGNDIFGVFNDDDDTTRDTIEDFTTGEGTDAADEIHLKGFATGAIAFVSIPVADTARAAVQVGGVTVAIVDVGAGDANFTPMDANPDADPPVEAKSRVQRIIEALGKNNVAGAGVVRKVSFKSAKCNSN